MDSASSIHIDLAAVDSNVAAVARMVGPACRRCAVVKADAYGLGARAIAPALVRAGVDMLAVFRDSEAIELGDLGIPVLVLAPVRRMERAGEVHRLALTGRLHMAVHGLAHCADLARAAADCGVQVPVHVEVDSGMGRGGCLPDEAQQVVARVLSSRSLKLAGIFSHFADSGADPAGTAEQTTLFRHFLAGLGALPEGVVCHIANSQAIWRGASTHFSMVRFGLAWTGFADDGFTCESGGSGPQLAGAVSWRSRAVEVRTVRAGQSVGYGGLWRCERDSTLAIVPVGYADGYPARDPAGARRIVRIRSGAGAEWAEVPIVGAVSMDQMSVDVSALARGGEAPAPGWEVEIAGSDARAGNYLPTVARCGMSHAYELLCRLHPRMPRVVHRMESTGSSAVIDDPSRALPMNAAVGA